MFSRPVFSSPLWIRTMVEKARKCGKSDWANRGSVRTVPARGKRGCRKLPLALDARLKGFTDARFQNFGYRSASRAERQDPHATEVACFDLCLLRSGDQRSRGRDYVLDAG